MRKICSMIIVLLLTLSTFIPTAFAQESLGEKIVSTAKQYIGIPYRYGGTTTAGFDCSGFTSFVYRKFGIHLPRTSASQYNVGTSIHKNDLKPGDLVFFTTTSKQISHVGIYIGNNQFISATTSKGIKVDSLNDPYYWGSRYVGAKRVITEQDPLEAKIQSLKPGEYLDVPANSWMYEAIYQLSNDGIFSGYDNHTFKPENKITRAEVAKLLSTAFDLNPSSSTNMNFSDVSKEHWAYDYIVAVAEKGFLSGSDHKFNPDTPITRAEVAAVISRAFNLSQENGATVSLKDVSADHWAYEYIQALATNGIAHVYDDKTYKPNQQTTRGEFAYFLYHAMKAND